MTRYFYTDPQAVDWMIDKYGMEFQDEHGNEIEVVDGVMLGNAFSDGDTTTPERAYIHPDSLHLLGPREGDTVIPGQDHPSSVVAVARIEVLIADGQSRVVQRDGKAFMWPESEAV